MTSRPRTPPQEAEGRTDSDPEHVGLVELAKADAELFRDAPQQGMEPGKVGREDSPAITNAEQFSPIDQDCNLVHRGAHRSGRFPLGQLSLSF